MRIGRVCDSVAAVANVTSWLLLLTVLLGPQGQACGNAGVKRHLVLGAWLLSFRTTFSRFVTARMLLYFIAKSAPVFYLCIH